MTLSIQNGSSSVAFCGKTPSAKHIIRQMRHNNRVFFKPDMNNLYERAGAKSPYNAVEFLHAQFENMADLVSITFKKFCSIFKK